MANGRHIHRRRRSAVVLVVLAALARRRAAVGGRRVRGDALRTHARRPDHAGRVDRGRRRQRDDPSAGDRGGPCGRPRRAQQAGDRHGGTRPLDRLAGDARPAGDRHRGGVAGDEGRAGPRHPRPRLAPPPRRVPRGEHPARRHVGGPRRRRFRQHDREANVRRAGGRLDRYHAIPGRHHDGPRASPARSSMPRRPRSRSRRPSRMDAPTWPCGRRRCSRRSPTTPSATRSWSGSTRTGCTSTTGSRSCARGRSRPRSRGSPPRPGCGGSTTRRSNPTWHNPAVNGWGSGEPAVIPGGPGNPMGPRAIYITAPGLIRIHGTSDEASIGRYASHGCIRMHNERGRCSSIRRSRWGTTS